MTEKRRVRGAGIVTKLDDHELAERGARTFEACGIILLNAADELRKNVRDDQGKPVGIIYNFVRIMAMSEDLADICDLAGGTIKKRNGMPIDVPISSYSNIAPAYHEWLVSYDLAVFNERQTLFGGTNQ